MDYNQVMAMMEQYWQDGKDFSALYHDCKALAAAGKTPLGLNQWVKSDKPLMEDFNEDNRIIDEKLRELNNAKADKLAPQVCFLPIEQGVTGEVLYYKNDMQQVVVSGCVAKSGSFSVAAYTKIGTLPAGFRPRSRQDRVGLLTNSGGAQAAAHVTQVLIQADGSIEFAVLPNHINMNYMCFEATFIAQQLQLP